MNIALHLLGQCFVDHAVAGDQRAAAEPGRHHVHPVMPAALGTYMAGMAVAVVLDVEAGRGQDGFERPADVVNAERHRFRVRRGSGK